MLILSIFVMGFGIYYYLSILLGAGPRDGLMVALVKKTDKPVWLIRNGIELIVLIVGYFLGGPVGIGTVVYAVGIGYIIQWVFKLYKFNTKEVVHKSIMDNYNDIKRAVEYGKGN